jgi:uncharacterized protein YndB with AHSA1/START domain
MRGWALILGLSLVASGARAEVAERWDTGFKLVNVVQVSAPPDRVYQALGEIGRWWDPEHSYGGTMSLELRPGGCWCEPTAGGGVRHGAVEMALPGQTLRLSGGLGPLQQEGLSAVLTYQLNAKDGGTEVTQTYMIGGARPDVIKQFPAPVDGVIKAALLRFERYVETGKPN